MVEQINNNVPNMLQKFVIDNRQNSYQNQNLSNRADLAIKPDTVEISADNKKSKVQKYLPLAVIGLLAIAVLAIAKRKSVKNLSSEFASRAKSDAETLMPEADRDRYVPPADPPSCGGTSSSLVTEGPKEIKPKTVKPEITFPKFESKYPLGSKEYFDERLNYLYRVWYEIAPKKDEEIFIKFMDMFDELNKTAKSTNLGPFTEFLELSAYFSSFEETMTNKLLDRFLDSYRRHIEDFDIKLYEKAIHGPTYLHELCNKYSKVATKDTIMKLLKEFERTGCDDYIEVRGMGDSSAMELYFKHLTPEEQKEITAESQRVARVLEERSKHAGELKKLKEKGN